MHKIAIFASGSGTNAENIIRYFSQNKQAEISLVLANKPDAYVLKRAEKLGVPSFYFPNSFFKNDKEVAAFLANYKIDFLVLAGFLLKIPAGLSERFAHRIINIHPALLPKYGGKGMYGMRVHEAVIANKEKESGISIHYVNENYDEGEIIFQAKTTISKEDTAENLAKKIHQLEYKYYPKVIAQCIEK
jgi:phosphoribosylglycinamide formyltransferase-1